MPHLPLFATPVSMYELPGMEAINREITERLIAESERVPSVHVSNVGGWHSKVDLHRREEPCFRTLMQRIVERVKETSDAVARDVGHTFPEMRAKTQAWAMVMRNGDYTIPHDHSEVHWATVYYPDAGDADESAHPESGLLALVDPRQGGRPIPGLDLVGATFLAKPATGRLYVFPGWLLHYVHSYRGTRPRVAISCNVIFDAVVVPAR